MTSPKHVHLRTRLLQRIAEGVWTDRLPTEAELCEEFAVSRPTVRAALSSLARDGIVHRKAGVGTFVSASRAQFGVSGLTLVLDGRVADFPTVRQQVVHFETTPSPPSVRPRLGLSPSSRTVFVERIGLVDEVPATVERAFVPATIAEGRVSASDFEKTPVLSDVLRVRTSVNPAHTHTCLSVTTSDPRVAELLRSEPGCPVIRLRRQTSDESGQPVLYVESFLVADRFAFHLESLA